MSLKKYGHFPHLLQLVVVEQGAVEWISLSPIITRQQAVWKTSYMIIYDNLFHQFATFVSQPEKFLKPFIFVTGDNLRHGKELKKRSSEELLAVNIITAYT